MRRLQNWPGCADAAGSARNSLPAEGVASCSAGRRTANIRAMLTPSPLPAAPEAATRAASQALGELARRRAAAAARRRARRVSPPFGPHPDACPGRASSAASFPDWHAARLLAELMDGLIVDAVRLCLSLHARARAPSSTGCARRDRRLRPRRAGAVQRHRPAVPDRSRADAGSAAQVVEFMLYFLWDLGLKVGHATRSVDDCLAEAKEDATVRTACWMRACSPAMRRCSRFRARFRAACQRRPAPAGLHRRQAGRARRAPSPLRREPVHGRAEHQGRHAAACATCRRCTGWRRYLFGPQHRRAWRTHGPGGAMLIVTGAKRGCAALAGISCGPCASTCTTSPAGPRSG